MTGTLNKMSPKPVNPPGTPQAEQRCEFCLISLDVFGKPKHRSIISRDPDYIAANAAMYCIECRQEKLGKIPDSYYLDPDLKRKRIAHQRLRKALHPFGESSYGPREPEAPDEPIHRG